MELGSCVSLDNTMHAVNPDTRWPSPKGAEQTGEPRTAQQRDAAQLLQISGHTLSQAGEDGDGDAFLPARPRRARRKQRQQLQQSLQRPYPSPGTEASMSETAALLQPVSESGDCALQEEAMTRASLPDSEKREETPSTASCSSEVAVCANSELILSTGCAEEGDKLVGSGRHVEEANMKKKATAVAGELSGHVADSARRASTRGKVNIWNERKPVYELRRLYVPAHRLTPLRKQWIMLIEPLVTHLQLQVRMNVRRRCVELRRSPTCSSNGVSGMLEETSSLLQKGSDYVRAFLLGFAVRDALALLRLDDLDVETFEVRDVKRLGGDHLSRCLARLSGKDGKTKFAIENATRTRLVIADSKIHILGSFENIRLARHACCSLILGAPPGKVYNHLRTVTRRLAERL